MCRASETSVETSRSLNISNVWYSQMYKIVIGKLYKIRKQTRDSNYINWLAFTIYRRSVG